LHSVSSADNIGDMRGSLHAQNPHLLLAVALVGSVGAVMSVIGLALGYRPPPGGYFLIVIGGVITGLCWWLYFHLRSANESHTDQYP
jgi:hypothetical protein